MKVATFKFNDVKGRLPRLLEWLEEPRLGVVCLPEIKTGDATVSIKPKNHAALVWCAALFSSYCGRSAFELIG